MTIDPIVSVRTAVCEIERAYYAFPASIFLIHDLIGLYLSPFYAQYGNLFLIRHSDSSFSQLPNQSLSLQSIQLVIALIYDNNFTQTYCY